MNHISYAMGQAKAVSSDSISESEPNETVNSQNDYISFYFRFEKSMLDRGYMNNAKSLRDLHRLLTDTKVMSEMDSIIVVATASPEGNPEYNNRLSQRRAKAVKGYIIWKYPTIEQSKIKAYHTGEDWDGLKRMVLEDNEMPYRDKVLAVIEQNVNPAIKEWRLKQIADGRAWSYIIRNYLRYLRTGATCVIFYMKHNPETVGELEKKKPDIEDITIALPSLVENPQDQPLLKPMAEDTVIELNDYRYIRSLSLKTNLLYDLASVINIEVEVPLSKHWSVAGEWMFPWWLSNKKQNALQWHKATIEGRYWFSPNYKKQDSSLEQHNPFTSWFIGLYGSGEYYDFENSKKGVQAEGFSVGISAGYALPISRSFNIEFSLGVGYMQTALWNYTARQDGNGDWHLLKDYTSKRSVSSFIIPTKIKESDIWLFPFKAKVSLVWYPHFRVKKGGMR